MATRKKPSKLVCHQMGPYQTLRAENWWTQLLERFRVFFYFECFGCYTKWVHISRDVLFLKKKPPAGQNRDNEDWRTEFVFTRIPKSQNPKSRISKSQNPQDPQIPNPEVCNPGSKNNPKIKIVVFWKVSELANSKLSNQFAAVYGPILN